MRHQSPFSSETTPEDLDTIFRQVRFIHLAFLASTLIYLVLLLLIFPRKADWDEAQTLIEKL